MTEPLQLYPGSSNQRLHNCTCNNTVADVSKMHVLLKKRGPQCLEERYDHYPCSFNVKTALLDAAYQGHTQCVEFLINHGANIHAETNKEEDIMILAIYSGSEELVTFLLDRGIGPNYKTVKYWEKPIRGTTFYLRNAACIPDPDMVQIFIDYGVNLNDFKDFNTDIGEYHFFSPSVRAMFNCSPKCLKTLLLNGSAIDHRQIQRTDISPEFKDSVSLIHHFVITCGRVVRDLLSDREILFILYQLGANLWQKNRLYMTPLQVREDKEVWLDEDWERGYEETGIEDGFLNPEPAAFNEITEYLRELMGKPLTLQSLSRLVIMRAMGPNYIRNIHKLPLPNEVISFLRANDVPANIY